MLAIPVRKSPARLWPALAALSALAAMAGGCQTPLEEPGARAMSLSIENVEICYYVDAATGGRTLQPDASFTRGDMAWLYFEVHAPTVREGGGGAEVWVSVSELSLFGPGGTLEGHSVDTIGVHETALTESPTFVWLFAYALTDADAVAGQYRWEFEVTDKLSGATAAGSAGFTLK